MNDSELLQAWVTRRDEAAFAELVCRHLGLVHASARRQVGASPLADDIAQAVFLVLARKAGSLGSGVVLSGWLFRTTRFVAARALRAEQRRYHHETAAAMQPADAAAVPEHWKEIEPYLDDALASLSATDRDAVLLRFFEGKPLRAVGEELGVNEDAARKRIVRAVEKLREWLSGRGVVLTAAGFAAVLANLPVGAAPAGLAAQISGAVTANAAGAGAVSLASGAIRDWWLAQVRRLLPWAVTALLLLIVAGRVLVDLQAMPVSAATIGPQAQAAPEQTVVTQAAPSVASDAPAKVVPSKILLSVRSAADNRSLVAQVNVWTASRRAFLESRDTRTDTDGVIEIPVATPEVNLVVVNVAVPGFVPKSMEWRRHEFVEPVLFYQCLLDRGQVLEGIVQDENGSPVPSAEVLFESSGYHKDAEREDVYFRPRFTKVSTDMGGRFRSDQLPMIINSEEVVRYAVVHPEFVPAGVSMRSTKSYATNHVIVLRRGEWITGRIEDSNQSPLSGAKIQELASPGGRKAISGPDGVFKLGPFSQGSVKLEASLNGFAEAKQTVVVGDESEKVVIRLAFDDGSQPKWQPEATRVVRLSGTVVDDESGKPLTRFLIRWHYQREFSPSRFSGNRDLLGQGHNGRFDWSVDMPLSDLFAGLDVAAEGYEDASSNGQAVAVGDHRFEFRMRRSSAKEVAIKGRVVDLSGEPVSNATVGSNGDGFGFQIKNDGTLLGWNNHDTNTDVNGIFSLHPKPNAKSLAVAHEAGFAEVPLPYTNRAPITLQPWGVVEGLVKTAGQPAPNQKVFLTVWPREPGKSPMDTLVMQTAITDSQGRFRFDHVPPVLVAVGRDYTVTTGEAAIGPRQRVDVQPDTTNEIAFVSSGRAIVGRFVLSQPVPGYHWRVDQQKLEQALPELPPILGAKGREEMQARIRAHSLRRMQMAAYFPDIRPDGTFRIDDVPAGDYVLKVRISVPPNGDDSMQQLPENRTELGAMKIPVAVHARDFTDPPLDLGTITIPVKIPER